MPKPPNIMLLQAEDTGRHHGCYGDAFATTPHIDGLAREGCLYRNAMTHTPVCAPSRGGMVAGMYPWTFGIHPMRTRLTQPPRLFTHELQAAGYHVHWPSKTDFNFHPPADFATSTQSWFDDGKLPASGRPFFVYQNFHVTHESQVWDRCNGHVNEWLMQRQREAPPQRRHNPMLAPIPPYLPDTPGVQLEVARYYDNLADQDAQVGRALDILEQSGEADNTIVIYLSDHGRGFCREKRWCYEAGIHLPLIVRVPPAMQVAGYKPGSEDDQLVAWVDIAPTILSLCGVDIPSHYHGRAFLGDAASPPRRYAFAGRDRMGEAFDKTRACRSREYLYLRNDFPQVPSMQRIGYMENGQATLALRMGNYLGSLSGPQAEWMAETKPAEELYRVADDPHCIRNLAADANQAAVLAEHRAALAEELSTRGDLGERDETELIHEGLIEDWLTTEYRPRVAPLPYQFDIGCGQTVVTANEAIERYGEAAG